jgi:hypothetical protein
MPETSARRRGAKVHNWSTGQPVVRYITIERAAELTGYTADAIRTKIRDGIWPEQNVWVRAPDNRVLIDIEGYHTWVEMGQAYTPRVKSRLKSPSPIEAFAAANESRSSPQPLT